MAEVRLNLFHPTRPHSKQQEVLNSLDSGERFVLLRAGRKFRKTSLMISWLIEKALETGLTAPYIAPSKVQAKNIVWDDHIQRLLTHFKQNNFPYKTNEVELSITFANGGKVQLFGVENKDALRGISNWCAVGADEYDDWSEDIWPLIIRPNLLTHKAPAIIAGTPKGFRNIYRLEESGLFKPFHFASHDNPDLDPKELQDLEEEYRQIGEDYYRQEILAEYMKPYGVVYEEWPLTNYTSCPYDPALPLHISFDFGVNDPTAIIWLQRMGGEFRVIDYHESKNADIGYYAQLIHSKPYKQPELVTGDAAGKSRSITTNTSPIDEYAKYGIHIRSLDGLKIPDQIRMTHKHIKSLFINKDNENTERFRELILNYKYPDKKDSAVNQSNEIPIHDEFSHGMRALEYYFANIDTSMSSFNINTLPQFSSNKKWGIG